MRVNVQGGTNAGNRPPLLPGRKHQWQCGGCGRINQRFVVRCLGPGCNQDRPK
jgi:hypothetical protein